MSILLTAGKNAVRSKPGKGKKKKKAPTAVVTRKPNFNPTPPKSTPKTAVWHWELDGVPTTVMFSVERNEVWCNGEVVDTTEDFSGFEGGDGASLEFFILMDETGSCHQASIRRSRPDLTAGASHQRLTHDLFVDGYMIIEHGNGSRPGGSVGPPPYTTPEPPSYEFAVSDMAPLRHEDKKTK